MKEIDKCDLQLSIEQFCNRQASQFVVVPVVPTPVNMSSFGFYCRCERHSLKQIDQFYGISLSRDEAIVHSVIIE